MNQTRNSFVKPTAMALALLMGLLTSGDASAKERKVKNSNDEAHVVAHIPFVGLSAVNMEIQKQGDDQYYLYVQHAKDEGISVVDIHKPARPKTVGLIAWPDPASRSVMNLTGNLAIIAESQIPQMGSDISKADLVLWDLSHPTAPRIVRKFSGVVKWLEDERNFIYVLNDEGLWIIAKPEEPQPETTTVPLFE